MFVTNNPNQFSIRPSRRPQTFFQKAKSTSWNKINRLASRIAQPLTFPGASVKFKKTIRLKKTEEELLSLGGKPLVLNTGDGESLEAMYLAVDEAIKALGGDEGTKAYAALHWSGRIFRFMSVPVSEKNQMLRENHDWEYQRQEIGVPIEGRGSSVRNFFSHFKLCSPAIEKKKVYLFSLGEIEARNPLENQIDGERPTVILCPGGGCTYQMLKKVLIPAYLKRGINVMAVNYRGYGNSTGVTTEQGMKTDIEAAYQYIRQIKSVPNERIIVHGHCLGSVPATELAANHEGIHLILDRPMANYNFALQDSLGICLGDYKERIGKKITPLLQPLVKGTISISGNIFIKIAAFFTIFLGKFDNVSKISRVKGSVAIIQSEQDKTLTSKHAELLANNVSQVSKDKGFKFIVCRKGHSESWIDEKDPKEKNADDHFDEFLKKSRLLGSLI